MSRDGSIAPDAATGTGAAIRARIDGIDMARGLAIMGMLAVHMGPTRPPADLAAELYALSHGRASILFMLVAGVGVSLLAASRRSSANQTRGRLLWRAALLLPLGLALQPLNHNVLVILQQYALMFVVAAALLGVRPRWLLAGAGASLVLGSAAFLAGRVLAPGTYNRAALSWGDGLGELLHGLVLSGPYPLITWAAPFLLGMYLGCCDLRDGRIQWALLVGGGLAAWLAARASAMLVESVGGSPSGWWNAVTDTAHSQMPLWMLGSLGSACLVLGLSLLAARALGRAVWPLVALGQLALSVYVAHLLALHWWRPTLHSHVVGEAAMNVLLFSAGAAVFAMAWRAFLPRGPLESLFRPPWELLPARYRTAEGPAPPAG